MKGNAARGEMIGCLGIVGIGLILGFLVLRMTPGQSTGHDHDHGHGHDDDEGPGGGGVELDETVISSSGIAIETASAAPIEHWVKIRGRLTTDRDKTVDIAPRLPGVIQLMTKNLGDRVSKGEVLAVVESSGARSAFEVRSWISGIIVDRQGVRGGFASAQEPLYKVVDLSTVWAEFDVPDMDQKAVKTGQKVRIKPIKGHAEIESVISYVSPQVVEDTQSMLVRVTLDNRSGALKPGSFVEAEILTDAVKAAVVVKRDALQTYEDRQVVFVRDGDRFEPRPVVLGTMDSDVVEVLSGLKGGESYAAANSFIVKAELLKSTAEHVH